MKIMTMEEYKKWRPVVQAQAKGIDPHVFNTQLGYIVNTISLMEYWLKKPEEKADEIKKYSEFYDRAMKEVNRLLKENAMKNVAV